MRDARGLIIFEDQPPGSFPSSAPFHCSHSPQLEESVRKKPSFASEWAPTNFILGSGGNCVIFNRKETDEIKKKSRLSRNDSENAAEFPNQSMKSFALFLPPL